MTAVTKFFIRILIISGVPTVAGCTALVPSQVLRPVETSHSLQGLACFQEGSVQNAAHSDSVTTRSVRLPGPMHHASPMLQKLHLKPVQTLFINICQASKALAVLQSLLQSPAGCGALAFPRSPMKADWKWQTCRSSPFDSVTQAPKTTLRRLEPKVPNLFKPQLCNSCTSEAEREMASESYLRTQPVTNDGAGYVLYCTSACMEL